MKRKKKGMACTACNEHIGSMAALPPLENMYEIEHLSPAGKYLEAATAPICHHVTCKRRTAQRDTNDETRKENEWQKNQK